MDMWFLGLDEVVLLESVMSHYVTPSLCGNGCKSELKFFSYGSYGPNAHLFGAVYIISRGGHLHMLCTDTHN